MQKLLKFSVIIFLLLSTAAFSQFKNYKLKGGVHYNMISPAGEIKRDLSSFFVRGFIAAELGPFFDAELGGGFMKWKQKDFLNADNAPVEIDIIPLDVRIRFELLGGRTKYVNPYIYIGGGVLRYKLKKYPNQTAYNYPYDLSKTEGWTGFFPAGGGLEVRLSKQALLDFSAGGMYSLNDKINSLAIGTPKDGWFNFALGFVVTGKGWKEDTDKDGLFDTDEENKYLTDPENPDTDSDGLKDGEEVKNYKTNPKNHDTDGDAVRDGMEVKDFITDPLKADTDGDVLNDGDEINKHNTNPRIADSDLDGLDDGSEVLSYKTDPNKADTDGDNLTDGDEINKYKTNPLAMDTDNGSVNDDIEVLRGTDPLNSEDDIVKEEMKIGEILILEGINFETNSSSITMVSETILMKAFNTMKNNPKMEVEISGHTDSRGSNSGNQRLSESRANSVKDWLVARGIDGNRITTVGYGEDMPIAPNDSPYNMQKNRRIEFKRIK